MTRKARVSFRQVLGDESGAALILAATAIFALVGLGALSVDVGYLFAAQRALQASTNAAAMAGAQDIGVNGTPILTATSYSSVTGKKNAYSGFTATMAAGYPKLWCFNTGGTCTTNQTPATSANGILVQQQATVPLYFGRIFGISSVQLSASAVALAAGGVPQPLNVIFIVDTTGSMNNNDPACGTTRIHCALNGVKTLLGELWPCASNLASCGAAVNGNVANPVDEAALMQFPGVESVPANFGCTSSLTSAWYSGIKGVTNATTAAGNNTLHFAATPAFNTGAQALVSEAGTQTSQATSSGNVLRFSGGMTAVSVNAPIQDASNNGIPGNAAYPPAIPVGTTVRSSTATTVTMSNSVNTSVGGVNSGDRITFGGIPAGAYITSVTGTTAVMNSAAAYGIPANDEIHVWPPVYGIVPLSSDYRTSDTSGLNASSNLVKCANALQVTGGTFYADAIIAAQSTLTANSRPGATNVIVLLTDGGSNAFNYPDFPFNYSGNYADYMLTANVANSCQQAVTAAQNAAKAGTWVYSIAYGATTSITGPTNSNPSCSFDSSPYNACYTMSQIANTPGASPGTYVNDPTKFYSDNANGCKSTANPNITSMNQIFQAIGYSLTTSRLLPSACFSNPSTSWC